MRIALVNPFAPPAAGPRCERWVELTRAFREVGHTIEWIASELPPGFGPVDTALLERSSAWLDRLTRLPTTASSRWRYSKDTGHLDRVRRLLAELVWPDSWAGFATEATGYLLQMKPAPEVVVTSSQPWSTLLVGYELRRRCGVPWVADIGDPWGFRILGSRTQRALDSIWERRLLRCADGITVTTARTRDLYAREYGVHPDHVEVVPAGVPEFPEFEHLPKSSGFTVLHVGTVYGPRASTRPFAEACSLLKTAHPGIFRLEWYGEIWRGVEGDLMRRSADVFADRIDGSRLVAREQAADVIVLFGNHGGLQVPAKVWRCLGTAKPLLVVAAGPDDPLAALRELRGRAIVCENSVQAIHSVLERLVNGESFRSVVGESPACELPSWGDRAGAILGVVRDSLHRRARNESRHSSATDVRWLSLLATVSGARLDDVIFRARSRSAQARAATARRNTGRHSGPGTGANA